MRSDCLGCQAFRSEREAQVRHGEGDLGDLLTRVALHEASAHCGSAPLHAIQSTPKHEENSDREHP
jgi:hypothetical protein